MISIGKVRVAEGVERETLAVGDKLMIVEFSFRREAEVREDYL